MELVLKQVRERSGMTQQQVANAIGIKVATYRTWEQGSVKLTLENAYIISDVLGCTPNDLCDWYATHPRERPRRSDPERDELGDCYDACTPDQRAGLLMSARNAAAASRDFSECPAVQEAV